MSNSILKKYGLSLEEAEVILDRAPSTALVYVFDHDRFYEESMAEFGGVLIEDLSSEVNELKKERQGLISGADALKAMMEGKRVLYSGYRNQDWDTALNCNLGVFLRHEKFPDFSFKIVPRTVKLEIEIPAPFEPKRGETAFLLTNDRFGYMEIEYQGHSTTLGAWRTEEEIKQVVAALRGIKG